MEKSMIQDLDSMRTSLGYKNTFTTSFGDGGFELKKSKISNLPSYKKSDLSLKLPFVVVFQTMEIERLSQQIEALRVALRDSQRQAFNCQSYEIQIRQLTDQCHQYDIELAEYKQEIEKLNTISQKLYEELEEWKQKYKNFDPLITEKHNVKIQQCQNLENQLNKWKDRHKALEKSKDKEMQDLKLAMESQRKSLLDRQIKQLSIKFDNERNYLQNQIRKMQEAVDQRDNQITKIKYEAQALRIENQTNVQASKKLKQSDYKINKLTEELVRLNQLLRRKHEEIERKETDEDYLKEMIKSLQRQKMAHQNQAIKIPQLEGAIKEWTVRYARLENENNENQQQVQRIPGLERNIENCTIEIERLGMIVKAKLQEVNDANLKIERLKALYEQSKKSQQKVPGLERKITEMGYEFQRLNDIMKKRLIEIEEGKNRISLLEKTLKAFEQAEPEKRKTEQEYRKQIRQIQKNKKEISELQKQVRKIPELQAIISDERNIREQYTRQVDRLNKVLRDKCQQVDTLSQKIYHLERKIIQLSNIESQIQNYKNQNNRMVQQIDNMNGKIKQKCDELQNLVKAVINLERNLDNYKEMQRKLIANIQNTQKIIQELNSTKNQLKNTQHKLLECQSQLNQAKNMIIQINNDREMLNRNLNIKIQQLEHAKIEINQCLEQIQQLREVQRYYHTLQEEMRLTLNKLKETQQLLRKQRAKNEELQYQNQMLVNEIEKIHRNGYFPQEFRQMYSAVKNNARQKQMQIQNLVRKQETMEKLIDEIQLMILNMCESMKVQNSQWMEINGKITDAVSNIKRISTLQDENNELRVQNLELESQIKILNLEISDIEGKKNAGKSSLLPTNTNTFTSNTTHSLTGTSSSLSSYATNSKKTIDPIVQNQSSSRVSSILIGNSKRILGSSSTLNIGPIIMNSTSKSKLEQTNGSSKQLSTNLNSTSNLNFNSVSSYQLNTNSVSSGITTSRGMSRDVNINTTSNMTTSFMSPQHSSTIKNTPILKQSTQSYFTMKTTKSSSIKQPFTFKSCYRS